jgi:signal transduction histidine kinase
LRPFPPSAITPHGGTTRNTIERPHVKLSTRLLLPLLATVTLVMLAYAWWSLWQRVSFMVAEAEMETRAYANALGLALEHPVGQSDLEAVQVTVDRVDRDPNIYGVVIYDTTGATQYVSSLLAPAERASIADVRAVLSTSSIQTARRMLDGELAVTVLRPLLDEKGGVHGVLEVVQPLTEMNAQLARTRIRFVLNTLTLIVVVTLLLTWLVRRYLSEPMSGFVRAAQVLGSGDLTYRVKTETRVGELDEVGLELNRMADRLEDARQEVLRESEERVSLERRLSQSERLAEVGRLAADLAHEIGAPLHVIRGRADLVLKDDADRERNLRIIIGQIDRITNIVRSLLGYARRRVPKPVEADLVNVVRSVVEFIEVEAHRQGTQLTIEHEPEAIVMRADPDLLHQVFLNVLLNALHAVGETDGVGRIVVRVSRNRDRATVDVEDNGSGIPQETRDRVFDPFFTTKFASKGTGLGLALARGIVEDHGGSIALVAASSEAWSTRVRIELPVGPVAAPLPGPVPGPMTGAASA